jgi:CcmD family protein
VRFPGGLAAALVLALLLVVATAPAQQELGLEPAADEVAEPAPVVTRAPSNLVPVGTALTISGTVRVAGTVDRSTVQETAVDGVAGFGFVLVGPGGDPLQVEGAGKLPHGFDVALSVVVVGEASGGRLRASEVLVPGAAEGPDPDRGLKAVLVVNMVVWLGLFACVLRLGHKLRQLEGR